MFPKVNPTNTASWKKLASLYQSEAKDISIKTLFETNQNRFNEFSIDFDGLLFDFSKNILNNTILSELLNLADECKLKEAIDAMFSGDKINETENRAVLHAALRDFSNNEIHLDGENLSDKIKKEKLKIKEFCKKIHSGKHKGYSGKSIRKIVNIGIGGSDLGPKMVVEALKNYWINGLEIEFVSNIDSNQILDILKTSNPEETLFIVVSKTFTTQETLVNAQSAKKWFLNHVNNENAISKHFIAVSSSVEKAIDFGISLENVFEIWDWVGGRFSLWSSVGISIALMTGYDNFEKLLKGAEKIDKHFKNQNFNENIPVLMALISIWNINFLNFEVEGIFPYNNKLSLFPAYLQQTVMESNGKSVDRNGNYVEYKTCPIVFGEVGTNAQHSFFQLLHQGTSKISSDFIFIKQSKHVLKNHQDILFSNFVSQTEALMNGKNESANISIKDSSFKSFKGNKPTNSIYIDDLTPENIGKLIAIYEHKTFVQGVIWNIYSFDQWGVELGKELANQKLSKTNKNHLDSSTRNLISIYNNL